VSLDNGWLGKEINEFNFDPLIKYKRSKNINIHGHGKQTFKEGGYSGEYQNDMFNGFGVQMEEQCTIHLGMII